MEYINYNYVLELAFHLLAKSYTMSKLETIVFVTVLKVLTSHHC